MNKIKKLGLSALAGSLAAFSAQAGELSVSGKITDINGVKIVGYENVPSRLASDASALYAKNILNFLKPIIDSEKSAFRVDWDDEIIKSTVITRGGAVVNSIVKEGN